MYFYESANKNNNDINNNCQYRTSQNIFEHLDRPIESSSMKQVHVLKHLPQLPMHM